MRAKLMLAALVVTALVAASASAAPVGQYNPITGDTTYHPSRPGDTSMLEFAVGSAGEVPLSERAGNAIFSQTPHDGSGFGFFSDGVPGQYYGQRIADNFSLGGGGSVNGVRWWGSSEYFYFPTYVHQTDFVVEIYGDAGGAPGGSLTGPMTYTTAATTPTPVGVGTFGQTIYAQSVKFAPINLGPGNYWVSVGSIQGGNPFGDAFVWASTLGAGDGTIAADFFDGAGYNVFAGAGDVAFEIQTPEPASLALLGLGGLFLRRRR